MMRGLLRFVIQFKTPTLWILLRFWIDVRLPLCVLKASYRIYFSYISKVCFVPKMSKIGLTFLCKLDHFGVKNRENLLINKKIMNKKPFHRLSNRKTLYAIDAKRRILWQWNFTHIINWWILKVQISENIRKFKISKI